ncbi:SAGA complex subunit Sgf73 [Malassezia cuniculi]|uniref:SAGA complex subunit Sgf73 n=1 Tax=Malassezia cuniculi TaxID=948313 RepID=A0AAF0J5K4_9BASI|nr:SAGA complex subunit Sgf73 [Malassezia cuniculi]
MAAAGWDDIIAETRSHELPWLVDDADVTEFGGFSLDDDIDVVVCDACSKPVLREAYSYHKENCGLARAIAEGRTSPGILDADDGNREERAAVPEKRKTGGKKSRGPINLDRQCGVINDKGLPCSRSLTCKSHSMGAKRNVPGRSQPYDTLLFEWQKATNPAFVARLEEKERAIAAQRSGSGGKEKKRKTAGDRLRNDGGDGDMTPAQASRNDEMLADMYSEGSTYAAVDEALASTLATIQRATTYDRTHVLPLATRSYAGMYTLRIRRYRMLRSLLTQGLSGSAHMRAKEAESSATATRTKA